MTGKNLQAGLPARVLALALATGLILPPQPAHALRQVNAGMESSTVHQELADHLTADPAAGDPEMRSPAPIPVGILSPYSRWESHPSSAQEIILPQSENLLPRRITLEEAKQGPFHPLPVPGTSPPGIKRAGSKTTAADGVSLPPEGTPLTWYGNPEQPGELLPNDLLKITDPEEPRLVIPAAQISPDIVISAEIGTLDPILIALHTTGVDLRTFKPGEVPAPVADRENVYVVRETAGARPRDGIPEDALVIALGPNAAPESPGHLGAMINAARAADDRVVRVSGVYYSGLEASVIAISTGA